MYGHTNYNTSTPAAIMGLEQAKARIAHLEARRGFWRSLAAQKDEQVALMKDRLSVATQEASLLRSKLSLVQNGPSGSVAALKDQLAKATADVNRLRKARNEWRAAAGGSSGDNPADFAGKADTDQSDRIEELENEVEELRSTLSEIRSLAD